MKIPFLSKLMPYLRSNQVLSLAGNLVASGLAVVSVSLLFRVLPVPDIGAWVFFMTMLGLGNALRAGCDDGIRAALQARLGNASALVQEHVKWALLQ